MGITDKTRKLLWARSGNQCAYCRQPLIASDETGEIHAIVGDECHIVSGAIQGPRTDAAYPTSQIDDYDNLILLCRVHHKLVDDLPIQYPAAVLRKLKALHERRVSNALKQHKSGLTQPEYLARLMTGGDLLAVVIGAYAYQYSHDEPVDEPEADLLAGFYRMRKIGEISATRWKWANASG